MLFVTLAPDPLFNSNGTVIEDFGGQGDAASAVAWRIDGKVFVAGTAEVGDVQSFALVCYNFDGSLDTSFQGGKIVTPVGPAESFATDILVQSNGRIVVAGRTGLNSQADSFALVRYNLDGTLDTSFGSGGKVTTLVDTHSRINGIALQVDGRIVVVGEGLDADNHVLHHVVARYNTDGSLDSSFGTAGIVAINTSQNGGGLYRVAIQSNGKIVVVGSDGSPFVQHGLIMRLNTDGTLDTSFGTAGKVTVDNVDNSHNIVNYASVSAVTIQGDGKIVIGGAVEFSDNPANYFERTAYLRRLNTDGTTDTTFPLFEKHSPRLSVDSGDPSHEFVYISGIVVESENRLMISGMAGYGVGANFMSSTGSPAALSIDIAPGGVSPGVPYVYLPTPNYSFGSYYSDVAMYQPGVYVFTGPSTSDFVTTMLKETNDAVYAARMYRAYNPNADYHFFTIFKPEFDNAIAHGYRDETTGNSGFALLHVSKPGNTPLYRLYNLQTGRHYYTASLFERDSLVAINPPPASGPDTRTTGWRYEKEEGFIHTSQVAGTTEIFRLYNNNSGVHLYTQDANTKDGILTAYPGIWVQHDSLGYAFPVSASTTAAAASAPATAAAVMAMGDDADSPDDEESANEINGVADASASSIVDTSVAENSTSTELSSTDSDHSDEADDDASSFDLAFALSNDLTPWE